MMSVDGPSALRHGIWPKCSSWTRSVSHRRFLWRANVSSHQFRLKAIALMIVYLKVNVDRKSGENNASLRYLGYVGISLAM